MDQELVSSIGKGVLVLAAVAPGDTEKEAERLAAKVLKLKLWNDESGGQVQPLLRTAVPMFLHVSNRRLSGKRMSRI